MRLPYDERRNDGAMILAVTPEPWGGEPLCVDRQVGYLRWAEARFVPWHRICDVWGTHWDLHPIVEADARDAAGERGLPVRALGGGPRRGPD